MLCGVQEDTHTHPMDIDSNIDVLLEKASAFGDAKTFEPSNDAFDPRHRFGLL